MADALITIPVVGGPYNGATDEVEPAGLNENAPVMLEPIEAQDDPAAAFRPGALWAVYYPRCNVGGWQLVYEGSYTVEQIERKRAPRGDPGLN